MAELGTANIGGRAVPAWVLESTAEQVDNSKWFSRPNLLDNWYFADPINQRGASIYTTNGYTIDRWKLIVGTVAVIEGGLKLVRNDTYGYGTLSLPLEKASWLVGKTVTCSAIVDGLVYAGTIVVPTSGFSEQVPCGTNGSYVRILVDGDSISFEIIFLETEANASPWSAIKLELGSGQTVAHQDANGNWVPNDPPPNKALELAKCQRYFQTFRTQALRPAYAADFCPVMRTEPATGTLTIDGVTYHTASADL